jgi:hypothetical protein
MVAQPGDRGKTAGPIGTKLMTGRTSFDATFSRLHEASSEMRAANGLKTAESKIRSYPILTLLIRCNYKCYTEGE